MGELRDRQKRQRQDRIIATARRLFQAKDYNAVTVEEIADAADISSVTVFNYYGSKSGLLLSLVAESDRLLVEEIDAIVGKEFDSFQDAIMEFFSIIIDHTTSYMGRVTWRHIWATAIVERDTHLGQGFYAHDRKIVNCLSALLESLNSRGLIDENFDPIIGANIIYRIYLSHLIEFSSNRSLTLTTVKEKIHEEMAFLAQSAAK